MSKYAKSGCSEFILTAVGLWLTAIGNPPIVAGDGNPIGVVDATTPSWVVTCCILLNCRSFSVSANLTTRLEVAPYKFTSYPC